MVFNMDLRPAQPKKSYPPTSPIDAVTEHTSANLKPACERSEIRLARQYQTFIQYRLSVMGGEASCDLYQASLPVPQPLPFV